MDSRELKELLARVVRLRERHLEFREELEQLRQDSELVTMKAMILRAKMMAYTKKKVR